MTEEKSRTPEEMWADWARQELTDQAAELKELRRFKREAEKELRRFKKYSAALEKEVKTLREALRFYSDPDCYEKFGGDGLSEIDEDGGEWAQKVLKEIGE